jgi:two-component sensor histidine kinase
MNQEEVPDLTEKVNILLVDDQPGKLMSYELILQELGQNLLKASSAKEALELLLKNDVAVILSDVVMPDLDGFELAQLIRDHPRFKETAIIFISAINVTELDSLKGYELGGVDYVPVPVVPGVLRAKVRVFVDLYIKTRALALINDQLEQRVAERTAQLEAAIERQELLAREVDHRARNALAVIQSIVALTPPDDSAKFAEAIKGRIRAMAMAHNLLSESRWRGADLLNLVNDELAPYAQEDRVSVCGLPVSIAPTVAQNLALAVHELATNAAKYGALSSSGGRVWVNWRQEGEQLRIEWVEECAHEVTRPSKTGFGSKVIDASIKSQLGGHVQKDWRATGLNCTLSLPMTHFTLRERGQAQSGEDRPDIELTRIRNRHILVVEDEPLIAMMTTRSLRELEASVVGPFATASEATGALASRVDAALLDVNIGGEYVYELASELDKRGVPIIFITGYHAGAIDERFAQAPVLTKPVERDDLAAALTRVLGPRLVSRITA